MFERWEPGVSSTVMPFSDASRSSMLQRSPTFIRPQCRALSADRRRWHRQPVGASRRRSQLGFVPNRGARMMKTGRTGNIAVIVPDITNPYFASMVRAVERTARETELQVLLADTGRIPAEEVKAARALAPDVDGFVILSPRRLHRELDALGAMPAVFVQRPVRGHPSVLLRSAPAVHEALLHLASLGHRDLAFLGGPTGSWAAGERRAAVRKESEAAGLRSSRSTLPRPPSKRRPTPCRRCWSGATAAIAFNDQMALGVIAGLPGSGIPSRMT